MNERMMTRGTRDILEKKRNKCINELAILDGDFGHPRFCLLQDLVLENVEFGEYTPTG